MGSKKIQELQLDIPAFIRDGKPSVSSHKIKKCSTCHMSFYMLRVEESRECWRCKTHDKDDSVRDKTLLTK